MIMPVEVRELVIKATISQEGSSGASAITTTNSEGNEELIKICVEKVLEIINDKNGR
jgi:hypothetical protein